jgi:hypothetical protein
VQRSAAPGYARLRIDLDRQADGEIVLALARAHRLTPYDAAYLELAGRIGAPLATLTGSSRALPAPPRSPCSASSDLP